MRQKSPLAGEYRADNVVSSGGVDRTFSYYLPSTLKEGAALIFVLHGSISNGEAIRKMTGNEFDRACGDQPVYSRLCQWL